MKPVSCGLLIEFGKKFLLCHATGCKNAGAWGIPKGIRDNEAEDYLDTALRETKEETGLDFSDHKAYIFPFMEYSTDSKIVKVFHLKLEEPAPVEQMKCSSFVNLFGQQLPEVDRYCWANLEQARELVKNHMSQIFKKYQESHGYSN